MRHDWPVKKAIVDWPIRLKGNSKHISGNSFSPLGAQDKDISTSSYASHLQHRLCFCMVLFMMLHKVVLTF